MTENYSGTALTIAIIALFGMILIGGFVYSTNSEPVDITGTEIRVDGNTRKVTQNTADIATMSTSYNAKFDSIDRTLINLDTNRYSTNTNFNDNLLDNLDDDVEELQDLQECLEDFANDEDFSDLEDCIDDL